MKDGFRTSTGLVADICLSVGICLFVAMGLFEYNAYTSEQSPSPVQKEKKTLMTIHASGTFDVKMTPQAPDDKGAGAAIGRYSLDKQFHGDLAGTSKGEMLAVSTAVQGSAGYVAMEQ